MTPINFDQKLAQLNYIFTPSAPIMRRDLFFGRMKHVEQVIDAINEPGQHAVLYGDRGVGKTSLANILSESITGIVIAKVTCNRTENFKAIWAKVFRRITIMTKSQGFGFTAEEREKSAQLNLFESQPGEADSTDILETLEFLTTPILFIFDEFDSVRDEQARVKFADTIKILSDNSPHVTILLVGVAQNVNELIGLHPSNERCIKQIRLQRMSADELTQIVKNGVEKLEMSIDPFVQLDIVEFSQGFPHYTHLLTKYAAKVALTAKSNHIDRNYFDLGIEDALANVYETIRDLYQGAVISTHKGSIFANVLHACALAKEDEHGTFGAIDLEPHLHKLTGQIYRVPSFAYHLNRLCKEERGPVLVTVGSSKLHRYKFRHPLLRAFIRIKLYQSGVISGATSTPRQG